MTEVPGIADTTAWWSTAVTRIAPGEIELRGYPIEQLIGRLDFVSTIWLLTKGALPTETQSRLLQAALVASVDHGPQAPSIASARMAVTCGVGINSAIANGVNVLGDTHGGAGQQCVAVLHGIAATVAETGRDVDEVAAEVVAEHRARKAYVPGFGHRFHPRDPRRDVLLGLVEEAVTAGQLSGEYLRAGVAIESALATGTRRPPMNIDGVTAIVYAELGVEPELARGFFVLARSVGILAHAWEETGTGRRVKGPLPPPLLADYTGEPTREYPEG
ncbi:MULTISPECIES: citryl-CoA lyase [Actinoalloteichus]|uniref:citrate synthase (unknown stereospecificity) n=1 Tax=Actinoalloteichus fjordicus TaxID=1612552 RepID=A0AAC9LB57_9PSEU|nr:MULTISPECIES: citryl-CoA lyase [Actinoalloteichus]APU13195.1 Citrate synthase [Actinoalloteichus fjordicus]APU19146.1 Citrate synthase [Actinoalloteichus sp. GBA129-24]